MKNAIFVLAVLLPAFTCQARIITVDANAPGSNDGTSWLNAYNFLQDALIDANSSDKPIEIRVAQGVYTPDSNSAEPNGSGDREATFQLINGVTLKGGYAGYGEPDPDVRHIELYETVLSGDLSGNDVPVLDPYDLLDEPTRGENCRHVVTSCETDANVVLNGFTITGGNANGDSIPLYWGAGIYNENAPSLPDYECTTAGPTISNCTITRNSARGEGGGMYNRYSCQPQISNCTFVENSALWSGGAIKNDTSDPVITDCLFERNYAGRYEHSNGGAMDNEESSPVVTNCTFVANEANYGGAVGNWMGGSSPGFANCIFAGNSAIYGGAMWITNFHDIGSGSHPEFVNCTLVGNSATYGTALACTIGFDGVIPSDIQLVNCILWDGGNEIYNDDGSPITVSYSDILGGSGSVVDPCGTVVWGAGNVSADPCFADPNNGDYHLKSQAGRWDPNTSTWVVDSNTSPCIDAGDPMSPIGLESFPNGGIINMGAHGGTPEGSKSYFGKPPCEIIVAGDINGDCEVNFLDFWLIGLHWLENNN